MSTARSSYFLLTVVLLLGAAARAQSDSPGEEAERLIAEGVELRKQGQEREAFERFEQAYAVRPTPRALAQMGLASKSLRMFVQAEDYLSRALEAESDVWILENRAALVLALAVVEKNLAWLDVRANVPAELRVDGNSVGALPLKAPLRVRAGAIRIDIRAKGFEEWSSTETLVGGATGTVSATLKSIPSVIPRENRASPTSDRRKLAPASDGSRALWTWSAVGVGATGVVVGSVFGLRTLALKKDRDDECPAATCETTKGVELDKDARRAATWSTVGFVVGALGLGTATVLILTEPQTPSSVSRRSVELRVSPAGALAVGAF